MAGRTNDQESESALPCLLQGERGKEWLEQFEPQDRDAAILLIKSLRLVSHSEFERGIREAVFRHAAASKEPVALYAVREIGFAGDGGQLKRPEIKTEHAGLAGGRVISQIRKGTATQDKNRAHAIESYFVDRQTRPRMVRGINEIGSEGRVAQLITGLVREGGGRFLNHPSLEEMAQARCRLVLFINDSIGTSRQITEFLDAFEQSRTIKSWRSFHYIRYGLIVYSSSSAGLARLQRQRERYVFIQSECTSAGHSRWWPEQYRQAIIGLCEKYGKKTTKPKYSLGYKKSFGLVVFEHGCPNNAPAILWCDDLRSRVAGQKPWRGLFPGKSIPSDLAPCFGLRPDSQIGLKGLESVGQRRLAIGEWLRRGSAEGHALLMLLAVVAKKLRRVDIVAEVLGLSNSRCERLVEKAVKYELMTKDMILTDFGRQELQNAKVVAASLNELELRTEKFYYPRLLRGPGRV
jgi:hypothetical protein